MWISGLMGSHSRSCLAWSEDWQPSGDESAFIKWTGWTLAMAPSHDDSTINIVICIIIIIIISSRPAAAVAAARCRMSVANEELLTAWSIKEVTFPSHGLNPTQVNSIQLELIGSAATFIFVYPLKWKTKSAVRTSTFHLQPEMKLWKWAPPSE